MKLTKILAGRTSTLGRRSLVFSLLALVAVASIATASPLPGLSDPTACQLNPGDSKFPCFTADAPGTLLATLTLRTRLSLRQGTTSGVLISAVYRNSSGTLDFYYQVQNAGSSATAIARETDTSFVGWQTFVGFRPDGSSLTGTGFVDGTIAPVTDDRTTLGPGSTVGFSFNPPDSAKILPGLSSNVLVISTNATFFATGNAAIIDGGTQTVAAFQPAPSRPPFALLGLGLLAIGGIGRKIKARK